MICIIYSHTLSEMDPRLWCDPRSTWIIKVISVLVPLDLYNTIIYHGFIESRLRLVKRSGDLGQKQIDLIPRKTIGCNNSCGSYSGLTHWGRDKWTPFHRRHFQMHFFNENVWIPIKISLKFVPRGPITQTPVSGSCCLPLGALQSMWATWCKI